MVHATGLVDLERQYEHQLPSTTSRMDPTEQVANDCSQGRAARLQVVRSEDLFFVAKSESSRGLLCFAANC